MGPKVKAISAALFCAALLLAGCSGVKKQLGLEKQSPDEFRVVSRAPLTVPPSFTLRPPEPGAPRPQEGSTSQQARRAVFRAEEKAPQLSEVIPEDGRSAGERALLMNAGVAESAPDIRSLVNSETAEINAESEGFLEQLVFWRDQPPPGVVIDPNAEARRLSEAAALGQPVSGAGAPIIERREKGLLEGIF